MARIERRWDARQTGLEPITFAVDTAVSASRERVWSFLVHPKTAQLVNPEVVNAFRVPGSASDDVGEQHCSVVRQGGVLAVHLSEVVAIEEPRLVAFRWLTTPGGYTASYSLDLEGSRTRVTYQVEGQVAAGTRKSAEPAMRGNAAQALERFRAAVESGVTLPTEG